jgi:type IX secretion system PorP/SprF family membrane protein
MSKTIVFLLIFFSINLVVYGQQEKLLTHFMYDRFSFNPAACGLEGNVNASLIYRNQWDKVVGAPNSAVLNADADLNQVAIGGAGVTFYHDAIGFFKQNNLMLSYSYPFQIREAGMLNVGLGLGLINFGIDPDWIPPTTSNDQYLTSAASGSNLNANLGVLWKSFKGYYLGLSTTNLNAPTIKAMNFTFDRHYYFMAGNRFKNVLGPSKDVDCQMIVRSDFIKVSADFNARYLHQNLFYAGLSYRTTEALCFLVGFFPIKNTTLGYSYDLTLNGLNTISRGSHEIVVRYKYVIPEPPLEKSKHPRWL